MKEQHKLLKLKTNGIIRFATFAEIIYLKADGNYTCFVLRDATTYTMCHTLMNFELELGYPFFRCHKSYLINIIYIREINKRTYQVMLTTGDAIPFSRSKAKMIEEKMKSKIKVKKKI
jgi:DNA-binding LytR/AlgR family response regulator